MEHIIDACFNARWIICSISSERIRQYSNASNHNHPSTPFISQHKTQLKHSKSTNYTWLLRWNHPSIWFAYQIGVSVQYSLGEYVNSQIHKLKFSKPNFDLPSCTCTLVLRSPGLHHQILRLALGISGTFSQCVLTHKMEKMFNTQKGTYHQSNTHKQTN
jgi:hypothetical protein